MDAKRNRDIAPRDGIELQFRIVGTLHLQGGHRAVAREPGSQLWPPPLRRRQRETTRDARGIGQSSWHKAAERMMWLNGAG